METLREGEGDVGSEQEEEEEELERELADVTFEELQKARSKGFHSTLPKPASENKHRRANKNRPMEMSSKKPVGRFREVIQARKKQREKLQKLMKKSNDPKVIEELKNHVAWIDKQQRSGSAKSADAKILAEHKKKEREAAKQGKQPFYLKKSEVRERKLIEKYNHLKATGKLEDFIEKRRRRNAAKDRRHMPYRRVHDSE